jgi:hypothetical protein
LIVVSKIAVVEQRLSKLPQAMLNLPSISPYKLRLLERRPAKFGALLTMRGSPQTLWTQYGIPPDPSYSLPCAVVYYGRHGARPSPRILTGS